MLCPVAINCATYALSFLPYTVPRIFIFLPKLAESAFRKLSKPFSSFRLQPSVLAIIFAVLVPLNKLFTIFAGLSFSGLNTRLTVDGVQFPSVSSIISFFVIIPYSIPMVSVCSSVSLFVMRALILTLAPNFLIMFSINFSSAFGSIEAWFLRRVMNTVRAFSRSSAVALSSAFSAFFILFISDRLIV